MITRSVAAEPAVSVLPRDPGPRRFIARWNNAKSRRGGEARYIWHEAEGVRFSNGRVALDYGPGYDYLGQLEEALRQSGSYSIEWIDAI